MKLKTINNNKGSALLWCILMTIVVTILLGSIMAATYAYFNYTMFTVKRQQAYFTCRSAVDAVIAELSSTTNGATSKLLPKKNTTVELTDFELDSKLGEIKSATVTRESKNEKSDVQDKLIVKVTAEYAGEPYSIEATLLNQPLYFSGIALKELKLENDLVLGKNTDLYWNSDSEFNTKSAVGSVTVYGNLVTKKDAKIANGAIIAGHKFKSDVSFTKNGKYQKQIWKPTEYILSNTELKIFETNTTYTSSLPNTIRNLFNGTTTYRPCNNVVDGTSFGGVTGSVSNSLSQWLSSSSGLFNDLNEGNLAFTAQDDNALTINYIRFRSTPSYQWGSGYDYLNCRDISYIQYSASNERNRSDRVIPVTYLFAEDGQQIRIQFGKKPESASISGKINDWIRNGTSQLLSTFLDYRTNTSYIIVYLGKGAKLELGTPLGVENGIGKGKRVADNLVFPFSVYGEDGSELVLHDNVTVLGEIDVDKVTVKPGNNGVKVVYSTSNGSQVARQKVDQYWAVAQYKEGVK